MKELVAKYRALVALVLVSVVAVLGCKPSQTSAADRTTSGIAVALEEAKANPGAPVRVFDSKHPKFGDVGPNGAGWKIDSGTGDLVTPTGKVIEGLTAKESVFATCTSNVASLSGTSTSCDSITIAAGKRALLTAQGTGSQNGCWITASGAWTRCPDVATGSSASGAYFVSPGTSNKGLWLVTTTAGSDVVGTNSLTIVNVVAGGSYVTSVNGKGPGTITLSSYDIGAPNVIDVYAGTSTNIAAYTYANGASGVGATITGNSNGAFGTIDGVTIVANDPVKGVFWLQHGTNPFENGPYLLDVQGDGSTAYHATRLPNCDQSAEIDGSLIRVRHGLTRGGRLFRYRGLANPTVGATGLGWVTVDERPPPIFGFKYIDTFANYHQSVIPANGSYSSGGGYITSTATTTPAAGTSTATQIGVLVVGTGTATTGDGGLLYGVPGIFQYSDADYHEFDCDVMLPVLDDGVQTYQYQCGYTNNFHAPSVTIGAYIEYFKAGPATTFWSCVTNNGGGGSKTTTVSSVTVNAAQYYHLFGRHLAFSGQWDMYVDGVSICSNTTNLPAGGTALLVGSELGKSAGGTARVQDMDWVNATLLKTQGTAL